MNRAGRKKSNVKITSKAIAKIKVTFNNTIISITNLLGQVIAWSSCGCVGFKGSKQNTPYAAKKAAQDCAEKAFKLGVRELEVHIKGTGNNREAAIRPLAEVGHRITAIKDKTGIPYGGCRLPKKRNL